MENFKTVLVIEDDKITRHLLRAELENNFLVLEAATGERCLGILETHPSNIIVMDFNLPDYCGTDLIKKIRQITDIPLLVLSGEDSEEKKVKSFEFGADDFIAKPYNADLLIARINASLRRYEGLSHNDNTGHMNGHAAQPLKFNEWSLDPMKFQLFDEENNSADLTSREYELLRVLINNGDRALPREELCEAIREDNYIPTPRAIDVKITRIRKKIRDRADAPDIIRTIRGVGYMFNNSTIKK